MFFLRDVLAKDILARVFHLYNASGNAKTITWNSVLKVIKANQPRTCALELITEFTSKKRDSGSNIKSWCTSLSLLRLALIEESVTIPNATYIKVYEDQTTRLEHQHIASYTTFDELKGLVDACDTSDLPPFDPRACISARQSFQQHLIMILIPW